MVCLQRGHGLVALQSSEQRCELPLSWRRRGLHAANLERHALGCIVKQRSHGDGRHVGACDGARILHSVALAHDPRSVAAGAVAQAAGADDGVGRTRAAQRLLALPTAAVVSEHAVRRCRRARRCQCSRTSNLASISLNLTEFSMRRMGDQYWCGETKAEDTSTTRRTPAALAASATTRTPCVSAPQSAFDAHVSRLKRAAPGGLQSLG